MKIATWNIQGLRTKQPEVYKELEKLKVNIYKLTETKKKGRGSEEMENYNLLFSGVSEDSKAKKGSIHRITEKPQEEHNMLENSKRTNIKNGYAQKWT